MTPDPERPGDVFQCISAMPAYNKKSLEELRFEDYVKGNKTGTAVGAAPSAFGAAAPSAFGAAQPSAFGAAPATSAFGAAPAAAPAFGASAFGAPAASSAFGAPAAGGLFGAPAVSAAPAFGAFGAAAAAPAPAFGAAPAPAFGAAAPSAFSFAAPAASAAPSAFGAAPATSSAFGFGATPAAVPQAFGAVVSAAPSAFAFGGAAPAVSAAPAFGFGAPTSSANPFSLAAPAASSGLFGAASAAPTTSTSLFAPASSAAPAFGFGAGLTSTTSAFGLGAPAVSAASSLFAAPPAPAFGAGASLFGAPAAAPAMTSLFGAPAATPGYGGLFGAPQQAAPVPAVQASHNQNLYGAEAGMSGAGLVARQIASVEEGQKRLGGGVVGVGLPEVATLSAKSSVSASSVELPPSYTQLSRSAARIRPRGAAGGGGLRGGSTSSVALAARVRDGSLFDGALDAQVLSADVFVNRHAKKLVIDDSAAERVEAEVEAEAAAAGRGLNGRDRGGEGEAKHDVPPSPPSDGGFRLGARFHDGEVVWLHVDPDDTTITVEQLKQKLVQMRGQQGDHVAAARSLRLAHSGMLLDDQERVVDCALPNQATLHVLQMSGGARPEPAAGSRSFTRDRLDDSLQDVNFHDARSPLGAGDAGAGSSAAAPVLDDPEYSTSPSMDALGRMSDAQLSAVRDFTITRAGHGSISWVGETDVRGLVLRDLVAIEDKSVCVYDEDHKHDKPEEGEGLNKYAIVTLQGVFPPSGATERLRSKYRSRVERQTKQMGATLLEYDPTRGIWKFAVRHFSRYGLFTDESDDEAATASQRGGKPDGAVGGGRMAAGIEKENRSGGGNNEIDMDVDDEMVFSDESEEEQGQPRPARTDAPQIYAGLQSPLPTALGLDSSRVDGMRSSLFGDRSGGQPLQRVAERANDASPPPSSWGPIRGGAAPLAKAMPTSRARAAGLRPGPDMFRQGGGARAPAPAQPLPHGGSSSGATLTLTAAHEQHAPPAAFLPLGLERASVDVDVSPSFVMARGVSGGRVHVRNDMGLFMGRSFRASWGPNGQLVHSGRVLRPAGSGDSATTAALSPSPVRSTSGGGLAGANAVGSGAGLAHGTRHVVHVQSGLLDVSRRPLRHLCSKPEAWRRLLELELQTCLDASLADGEEVESSGSWPREVGPSGRDGTAEGEEVRRLRLPSGPLGSDGYSRLVACVQRLAAVCDAEAEAEGRHVDGYAAQLWRLVNALWGQERDPTLQDGEEGALDQDLLPTRDCRSVNACDRAEVSGAMRRREAVSQWLRDAVAEAAAAAGGRDDNADDGGAALRGSESGPSLFRRVLRLLAQQRVEEAAEAAADAGHLRLATLVAQACGEMQTRVLVEEQLEAWADSRALDLLPAPLIALFKILSGLGSNNEVTASFGLDAASGTDRDWRRALGLHVWHTAPPGSEPLADALERYQHAWTPAEVEDGDETHPAPRPVPWYVEQRLVVDVPSEDSDSKPVCDAQFRLLWLFCDSTGSRAGTDVAALSQLLDPRGLSPEPLDYCEAWLLLNVLEALGLYPAADTAGTAANVTMSFAAQLEAAGLWPWAIVVSMHLRDGGLRRAAVRALVLRHAHCATLNSEGSEHSEADKEYWRAREFLQSLGVPELWLEDAAVLRARYDRRPLDEVSHLLAAQRWPAAHAALLVHVAPRCVLEQQQPVLKRFLTALEGAGAPRNIAHWDVRGGLFLDYLRVREQAARLLADLAQPQRHHEPAQLLSALEQLGEALADVARRLQRLEPCRTWTSGELGGVAGRPTPEAETVFAVVMRTTVNNFIPRVQRALSQLRGDGGVDASTPPLQLSLQALHGMAGSGMQQSYRLAHLHSLSREFMSWRTASAASY